MEENNLKKEVLSSLKDYLIRFIPGTEKVIQLFRAGKEGEALKLMGDVIEGLQWIYDAGTHTQDVQKVKVELYEINPFLVEMIDALESMDYVLLCDLLEYEIIPVLNSWTDKL